MTLQKRIIPCLLLHNNGLVKTVEFKNSNYIGDPINAVKIFNEKEVDELILLDIEVTLKNREPNYKLLDRIICEASMPICYGGGVKDIEQMKQLYSIGIEKISLSSAVLENENLLISAADFFGRQSIVVTIDVKQFGYFNKKYCIVSHGGRKKHSIDLLEFIYSVCGKGAGELLINNVDRDGKMQGYDLELIKMIASNVNVPVIALGGAGKLEDLAQAILAGASGAAAGSLFVYAGVHRAVLINYPDTKELSEIFQ